MTRDYKLYMDWDGDGVFAPGDDVSEYVREAVSFSDGLPDDDEFCAPSQFVTTLNNADGFWSGEQALLRRGLMISFEAVRTATSYPLWRGTIARFTFYGEDGDDPRVVVEAEDGAAFLTDTEYAPKFQENVRVDEALRQVFESGVFIYPLPGAFGLLDAVGFSELDGHFRLFEERVTDFRVADTTLPFAGDNLDRGDGVNAQMYLREILACEAGGRFFWDAPTGKYVFHNRLRDAVAPLTTWTPGAPLSAPPPEIVWGGDVINHVDVYYETRVIGTPGEVVFVYDDLPFQIGAGKTRTVNARYTSANENAQVAVKDGIAPIWDTDYAATYDDDDSVVLPNVFAVFAEYAANTATISITNFSARAININNLQLRGTLVTTTRSRSVTSRAPTSIGRHGLHRQALNIRSINSETFAQQLADLRANQHSEPVKALKGVSYTADAGDDAEDAVLQARVGDVLAIDLGTGEGAYLILARNHQIDVSSAAHVAYYRVRPLGRSTVLILDNPLRDVLDAAILGL